MEIRREVLSSIHKRIEECSQLNAHYTSVSNNLASIRSDPSSLQELTPTELSDVVSTFPHLFQLESECAQLQSQVLEQKENLANDIASYVTNTRQFLCECYHYVFWNSSFLTRSSDRSIRFCSSVSAPRSPKTAGMTPFRRSLKRPPRRWFPCR